MTFLFLAILIYVGNAFLLKTGELYQQERLVVMGFNYIFATLVSAGLWAFQGTGMPGQATLVLGSVGGFFYASGLFFWMGAIAKVGLATSTATLRLSVVLPTVLSLLVFGEHPAGMQWGGIAITFAVLLLIGMEALLRDRAAPGNRGLPWLAAMFATMGGVGAIQKLFTELGQPHEKSALLSLVFLTAGVGCWAGILAGRRPLRRGDMLRGFLFGLGNVASNTFLLMGLERVPGVIAFPMVNVGIILATSVSGMLLWREHPGRLGGSAIALAAAALVLMSL